MCLEQINSKHHPPKKYSENHIGYKVFAEHPLKDGIYQPICWNCSLHFELGKEYEDTNDITISPYLEETSYQSGFHIFEDKENAVAYSIGDPVIEVEYNNVVAYGLEGLAPAVVARTMKLIRKVN